MNNRVPTSVVICTTVFLVIQVAAVTLVLVTKTDPDRLITFLATINALGIPALAALAKAEKNEKRIEQVNRKVNGHLTELANRAGLDDYNPETGIEP